MKKIVFVLLGLLIVNLNAEIYKMTIPLDIDGLGNNKIVYNGQSYNITKIIVIGNYIHSGGHYWIPIGRKEIPLTSAGIHETIVFEKHGPEFSEGQMSHSGLDVQVAFSTADNICFVKANASVSGCNNIEDTNFATFAQSYKIRSGVSITKQ